MSRLFVLMADLMVKCRYLPTTDQGIWAKRTFNEVWKTLGLRDSWLWGTSYVI